MVPIVMAIGVLVIGLLQVNFPSEVMVIIAMAIGVVVIAASQSDRRALNSNHSPLLLP